MLLLAQISEASANSMVAWIVGLSATVFALNQMLTFYKVHLKEQPSPATTYATKEELKQAQATNDKELREAHGRMNRERKELDAKIDDLKEQSDRLSEKLDTKIDELQERIDFVPNRTITMLRETKGLLG